MPEMQETGIQFLGLVDPLKNGKTTTSVFLLVKSHGLGSCCVTLYGVAMRQTQLGD